MSKIPPAPKVPHPGEFSHGRDRAIGEESEQDREDQAELLRRLGRWLDELPQNCALALENSRSSRVVRNEFEKILERKLILITDPEQRHIAIERLRDDLDTAIAKWRAAGGEEIFEPTEERGNEGGPDVRELSRAGIEQRLANDRAGLARELDPKPDRIAGTQTLGEFFDNLHEPLLGALESGDSVKVLRARFEAILERRLAENGLENDQEQCRLARSRLEADIAFAAEEWEKQRKRAQERFEKENGMAPSDSDIVLLAALERIPDQRRKLLAEPDSPHRRDREWYLNKIERDLLDKQKDRKIEALESRVKASEAEKVALQPPELSRRSLIGAVGGILAGIGISVVGNVRGYVSLLEEAAEIRHLNKIEAMFEDLREGGDVKDFTFAQRDKRRKAFLKKWGQNFTSYLGKYLEKNVRPNDIEEIFNLLTSVDCQGLLYKAFEEGISLHSSVEDNVFYSLSDARKREEKEGGVRGSVYGTATYSLEGGWMEKIVPNYWTKPEHYAVRAADWLPTSKSISPNEIDPRWNTFTRSGDPAAIQQSTVDVRENTKRLSGLGVQIATMQAEAGWSSPERVSRFMVYLDNQSVRDHLQASDCTLAEAYSIIKAAVHYEVTHAMGSLEDIVALLLDQRESFRGKMILSKDTQSFIQVSYSAKKREDSFPQEDLAHLADATEVALEHRIVIHTQHPKAAVELWNSIVYSKGDTCIYFNAHGWAEGIALNEEINFSYQELALALLERMKNVQDPQTLGEMTVIISACHGYDFIAEKLLTEMARLYKKSPFAKKTPWENIALPTIITQTQERELGWRNFLDDLVDHAGAIKKSGGLMGEILLRGVQPRHYSRADMTFFAGDPGQWAEFAARDKAALGADEVVPV